MGTGPIKYYPDRTKDGFILEESFFQISKLTIDDSTIWPNTRKIEFGNLVNSKTPNFVEVKDFSFIKN